MEILILNNFEYKNQPRVELPSNISYFKMKLLVFIFIAMNAVAGLSYKLMSKHTAQRRMDLMNQIMKQNSKHRSSKTQKRKRNRRNNDSNELAEYHVVREECKIKLNDDGRRALECTKNNQPPWNSIGLLAPIHDAVKWLNVHSSDQHEMTGTDNYRQMVRVKMS